MQSTIPRRIIQTGKNRELPLLGKAAVAGLRLLNPDFEYMFFDDADVERFIDTEFPQYRAVFDAFPVRIQRYDFFRYLAVYRHGGFYFDTDVLFAEGLEKLCDRGCVFPFEELSIHRFLIDEYGMDWEIGNYAFGAAPGHPFIGAIIDNCVKAQRDPEWAARMTAPIPRMFRDEFFVYDTTGPGLVSRTLAEYRNPAARVDVLFPDDVRDESKWHCFGNYGVHFQDGSWRNRKGLVHRRLRRLWETRERSSLLRASRARGPQRSLKFEHGT